MILIFAMIIICLMVFFYLSLIGWFPSDLMLSKIPQLPEWFWEHPTFIKLFLSTVSLGLFLVPIFSSFSKKIELVFFIVSASVVLVGLIFNNISHTIEIIEIKERMHH